MKKALIISSLAALMMLVCISSFLTSESEGYEIAVAYRGQTIILSAVLRDDLGNPISNETIYFYDGTNNIYLGNDVTNENGIAEMLWSIPKNYTLGLITLNATFQGNIEKNLKPSYQTFQLMLKSKTYISVLVTDTTLDPNDYTIAPGDEITVNVTITDDIGQPAEAINVSLIEDAKIIDQKLTDKNGEAVLKYRIPTNKLTDQVKLLVQAGPQKYYDKSEHSITLYVQKVKTNMTILKVDPIIVYRNQSVTILGKLIDEDENSLINAAIYVKTGEENISLTWTNTSGFFETTFHVPISIKPGRYVYTVSFTGSSRYEGVKRNITLIVRSNTILRFNFKNSTVIYSQIAKVNVTLTDDQNDPVSFKKLLVFDDKNNLLTSAFTDENGRALVQWLVYQNKGHTYITITFLGDEFYNMTILKISLTVFERPLLIVKKENNVTLVARNMQISIFIQLNSLQNDPLRNQLVHIYDVINCMCIGNVTTDHSGRARFTYTVPRNAILGQLVIKVVYLGNLEECFLHAEKYVVYTVVEKVPTKLILSVPEQTKAGEIIICKAKLQTIEEIPIGSEKIMIYLNNSLLTIVETNENGEALVKFNAPSNALLIIISIKYNGSEYYTASMCSLQIKMITPESNIFFLKNIVKTISVFCLLGLFVIIRRWRSSNETLSI